AAAITKPRASMPATVSNEPSPWCAMIASIASRNAVPSENNGVRSLNITPGCGKSGTSRTCRATLAATSGPLSPEAAWPAWSPDTVDCWSEVVTSPRCGYPERWSVAALAAAGPGATLAGAAALGLLAVAGGPGAGARRGGTGQYAALVVRGGHGVLLAV